MTNNIWKFSLALLVTSFAAQMTNIEADAQSNVVVDFIEEAPKAQWSNAHLILPFPGASNDDRGFARVINDVEIEDGETYDRVLQTHPRWRPHGIIVGRYKNITIPSAGAEFRADIGFIKGAGGSDGVFFEVWAEFPGHSDPLRREYHKPYTESVIEGFQQDFSRYRGRTGTIALVVDAGDKSSAQDWAVWIQPRLVSLENDFAFPQFVGGVVGSGRNGDQVLNPWGGTSGLLHGDIVLKLQFANMIFSTSLRIDSFHSGQFVGSTNLGQIAEGQETVWHTLSRSALGPWKEQVVFNGTYVGDIRYTVNDVGE